MGSTGRMLLLWGGLVAALTVAMGTAVSADTIYESSGYIAFEAETNATISDSVGTPGSTWVVQNLADASGGKALGASTGWNIENETATYSLEFDTAGTYEFYARLGVWDTSWSGEGDGGNDSYFRASTFNLTVPDIAVAVPYVSNPPYVTTFYPFDWQTVATYTVDAGQVGQTVTFSIGTRESGCTMDRMVFSLTTGLTATQLDALTNSQSGVEVPEPATMMLLGIGAAGLLRRRRAA